MDSDFGVFVPLLGRQLIPKLRAVSADCRAALAIPVACAQVVLGRSKPVLGGLAVELQRQGQVLGLGNAVVRHEAQVAPR